MAEIGLVEVTPADELVASEVDHYVSEIRLDALGSGGRVRAGD